MSPEREGKPDTRSIPEHLQRLGFARYADYLASEHWRDLRRRYWHESDQPHRCRCGRTQRLQLHHLTYERMGAEEFADLTLLCELCHASEHSRVINLIAAGRPHTPWIGVKSRGVRFITGKHQRVAQPDPHTRKKWRVGKAVRQVNDDLHAIQVANKAKQLARKQERERAT